MNRARKKNGANRLNALLRVELAAADTYQAAVAQLGAREEAEELQRIHFEHCEAAATLQDQIRKCEADADEDSNAWESLETSVDSAAALLRKSVALTSLQQGEEQGLNDYESALRDDALPAACKNIIVSKLLPQTRNHIAALNRLRALTA